MLSQKTNPELRFIVQLANKAFKLTISQKMQKHCVCIEYDPTLDFGNDSPSGSRLSGIEIHMNNAFKLQNTPEIQLSEVPECILVLLTYLKN